MDERILKWLYDIKLCIDEIDSFFQEEEKDFFVFSCSSCWGVLLV